jgi:probable HAF family extracellular repeat protein
MQDLGTLFGDVASLSISINDNGAVIGGFLNANFNPRAFLWEKGVMTDLNTLIAGHSRLYLLTGCSINSRGEITGLGLTSTSEIHTYLATPTHDNATSVSTSQGMVSPRTPSDDARKLLQHNCVWADLEPGSRGRNNDVALSRVCNGREVIERCRG